MKDKKPIVALTEIVSKLKHYSLNESLSLTAKSRLNSLCKLRVSTEQRKHSASFIAHKERESVRVNLIASV